jgi:hypothetical protein
MVITAGNNQTAPAGTVTPIAPTVRVMDAYGNGVAGVQVVWRPKDGFGTVTPGMTVTDAQGYASATWTLGAVGLNRLKAFLEQAPYSIAVFEATATLP